MGAKVQLFLRICKFFCTFAGKSKKITNEFKNSSANCKIVNRKIVNPYDIIRIYRAT